MGLTRRQITVPPLTEEQLADYEKQAAEVLRELVENPGTLPMGGAAVESSLAAIVQRLVAEVRRLRASAGEAYPPRPRRSRRGNR